MAYAPSALFLFIARALDGLTAGNIPVAFAVISDSTKIEERPRAFGLVGAAFSFGFVFGPATAALTLGFGQSVPFLIAGAITTVAVVLTALFLPETNKHRGETKHGRIFDFAKLWHTLFEPNVGPTFLISLIFFLAFSAAIIYGFQPFTMRVLHLNVTQNAYLFTMYGVVGLLTQTFLVQRFTKLIGVKKAFSFAILFTSVAMLIMYYSHTLFIFILASILMGIVNNTVQTLIPTILSQEADAKSQGSVMGLSASYQSIGMIVGPIVGGMIATIAIPLPFLLGSILVLLCFLLSFRVLRPGIHKESAF